MQKEDEKLVHCDNCRKDIPESKILLHQGFCLKNNKYCPTCSKVFLVGEFDEHMKTHVSEKKIPQKQVVTQKKVPQKKIPPKVEKPKFKRSCPCPKHGYGNAHDHDHDKEKDKEKKEKEKKIVKNYG